jgi:hypothetical protein
MTTVATLTWDATCPTGKHQREHNQSIIPVLEEAVRLMASSRYRNPMLLNLSIWCDVHVRHMLVEMPQSDYMPPGRFFMRLKMGEWSSPKDTSRVPITPGKPNVWERMDDKPVKSLELRCGDDQRVLIFIINSNETTFLGR